MLHSAVVIAVAAKGYRILLPIVVVIAVLAIDFVIELLLTFDPQMYRSFE